MVGWDLWRGKPSLTSPTDFYNQLMRTMGERKTEDCVYLNLNKAFP